MSEIIILESFHYFLQSQNIVDDITFSWDQIVSHPQRLKFLRESMVLISQGGGFYP